MANRKRKSGSSDRFYFLGFQNHRDGDCSHEIKRRLHVGRKAMTNLDNILKHHFSDKGLCNQSYGFSTSHVQMWESDDKEGWKSENCSVMFHSLQPHGLYSPRNSSGQNTEVGSLSLLQGIFPTQRSNPGLPHWKWILYQLSHKGSPRILEWDSLSLLQGIFPTQESNKGSPALQVDSLPTELWGKSMTLEMPICFQLIRA